MWEYIAAVLLAFTQEVTSSCGLVARTTKLSAMEWFLQVGDCLQHQDSIKISSNKTNVSER